MNAAVKAFVGVDAPGLDETLGSIDASGDLLDIVEVLGSIVALALIEVLDTREVLVLDDVLGSSDGLVGIKGLGCIESLDGVGVVVLAEHLSSIAFSALSVDLSRERQDGLGILQSIPALALANLVWSSIALDSAGVRLGWALSLSITSISQSKILHVEGML
jgi:hypothetical protein